MFRFWLKYTDGIDDYKKIWAELQGYVTEVMYSSGRNAGRKMGQANQHVERLIAQCTTRSNGQDDFLALATEVTEWVEKLSSEQNAAQFDTTRLFRSSRSSR